MSRGLLVPALLLVALPACTTVVVESPAIERALAASLERRRVDVLAEHVLDFREHVLPEGVDGGRVDHRSRAAAARAAIAALRAEAASIHRRRLDVEGAIDLDLCVQLLDAAADDLRLADAEDDRLSATGVLPDDLALLAVSAPDRGLPDRIGTAAAAPLAADPPVEGLEKEDLGRLMRRARQARDLARVRGQEAQVVFGDTGSRARADGLAERLEKLANHLQEKRKGLKDDSLADPVGREAFIALLRHQHGVDASPEELHAFGTKLLDGITAEIEALTRDSFPGMTWREALEKVRDDHATPETLPAEAMAAALEARDFCMERGFVTIPPEAALARVEIVGDGMARSYPFAAYSFRAATEEGEVGRYMVSPGATWMTAEQARERIRGNCRAWTRAVAPHEAWPGHHLQFWMSDKHASRLRRAASTPVLVEGWGHYCEGLLERHGYFTTPDQRLALLVMRAWRAARVRLDVDLHCNGMSFEDAVAMLVDRVAMTRDAAEAEVRRYLSMPTQPFSYAWGRHEIERLRADLEARDGAAFNEREFHDRLLRAGPIPFRYLRRLFGFNG